MTKRMLVDATHPEETRIAVIHDQRLMDLEIETSGKEQIKGNIYLAKVTRVEPSLQAAFVDFNGGRQGFLSVTDLNLKFFPNEGRGKKESVEPSPSVPVVPPLPATEPSVQNGDLDAELEGDVEGDANGDLDLDLEEGEDAHTTLDAAPRFRRRPTIPIQKILTRGQTILVQVVKEPRGGKGASLTTNISLAGRYTVLLPENSGGGGISRKIVDATERKELRLILSSMEVPPGVSLIIRTAGLGHTKRDITRDLSYLLRLWKMILEKSAVAKAPCLIHEEGDLIIRTIRDLYSADMEEILIDGQEGYRRGKDFMRLLMPRYVKVVQPYKDLKPIFARFLVENQIESMHERVIQLKSGGYLVVDITEALVAIDINSGRATREKDVESTAFKTNREAVFEIARQLRLRDLGGLVVIDFIDMEDRKHNVEIEKIFKEAIKGDRAKIQLGHISPFGLLELSRQRLKPTFSENNRQECPRCQGRGTIRSVESFSIQLFRRIEEEASQERYSRLHYLVPQEVANFLLNQKRVPLARLEETLDISICIQGSSDLLTPDFKVERTNRPKSLLVDEAKNVEALAKKELESKFISEEVLEEVPEEDLEEEQDDDELEPVAEPSKESKDASDDEVVATVEKVEIVRKRRRRRRRRRVPVRPVVAEQTGTIPGETSMGQNGESAGTTELVTTTSVPGLFTLTECVELHNTENTQEGGEELSAGTDPPSVVTAPSVSLPRARRRRRRRPPTRVASGGVNSTSEGRGEELPIADVVAPIIEIEQA
ncbi:MAG: ribonuclease E/G [Magnetococcus sp. DMHC-6]